MLLNQLKVVLKLFETEELDKVVSKKIYLFFFILTFGSQIKSRKLTTDESMSIITDSIVILTVAINASEIYE